MISKKYKIIYDIANAIMIYLLALSFCLGAATVVKTDLSASGNFPVIYAIASAVILVIFVCVRKMIGKQFISLLIHIVVCGAAFALVSGNFEKVVVVAFAVLLTIIDMNDFSRKKLDSYGEIHIASCLCFLILYALTEYAEQKGDYPSAGLYATLICLFCVLFFAFSLVRVYVANAMKLVDNAHMDEDAPIGYMYGNSNKFIGPIIVLIVAIMLVVQSTRSSNVIASMWFSLLKGVATVCNAITATGMDDVAAKGSTLYVVEVVIAAVIVIAVIALIITIIYKIYKSHWRKDLSADETLESAAMVEKREWIYHKESKKKSKYEDTSVTQAAEIPVPEIEVAKETSDTAEAETEAEEKSEQPGAEAETAAKAEPEAETEIKSEPEAAAVIEDPFPPADPFADYMPVKENEEEAKEETAKEEEPKKEEPQKPRIVEDPFPPADPFADYIKTDTDTDSEEE